MSTFINTAPYGLKLFNHANIQTLPETNQCSNNAVFLSGIWPENKTTNTTFPDFSPHFWDDQQFQYHFIFSAWIIRGPTVLLHPYCHDSSFGECFTASCYRLSRWGATVIFVLADVSVWSPKMIICHCKTMLFMGSKCSKNDQFNFDSKIAER